MAGCCVSREESKKNITKSQNPPTTVQTNSHAQGPALNALPEENKNKSNLQENDIEILDDEKPEIETETVQLDYFEKLFEGHDNYRPVYIELRQEIQNSQHEQESRKQMSEITRLKSDDPNKVTFYLHFLTNASKQNLKRSVRLGCPDPFMLAYKHQKINESQLKVELQLPSVFQGSVTEGITILSNELYDCVITELGEVQAQRGGSFRAQGYSLVEYREGMHAITIIKRYFLTDITNRNLLARLLTKDALKAITDFKNQLEQ